MKPTMRVEVTPGMQEEGETLEVALIVPTYDGELRFELRGERDADGDFRVFIPWFKDLHGNPAADHTDLVLDNGTGVTNGIVYLGAPEED